MHSLKHINIYSQLHGKTISRKAAMVFLKHLQEDIKSGRITKAKDKYCNEISRIQKSLIGIVNHDKIGDLIAINIIPASKKHYDGILKKQGLGNLPIMIAGAITSLTEHHIHKMLGAKKASLSGVSKEWGNDGSTPSNNEDYNSLYEMYPDNKKEAKVIWKQLTEKQKKGFLYDLDVTDAANEGIKKSWLKFIGEGGNKKLSGINKINFKEFKKKNSKEIKRAKDEVKEFLKPKKAVAGPQKSVKKKDGLVGNKRKSKSRKKNNIGSIEDHNKRVELVNVAVQEAIKPEVIEPYKPVHIKTGMSALQMQNHTYEELNFNEYWKNIFGKPATNFDMCIHAGPGTGKTVFLLKFANYLADNIGPVVYITPEEYGSATLVKKTRDFNITSPHLDFEPEILPASELKKYKFIFIDSVNRAKINCDEYQKIRKQVPDSAFILVLQQTKGGTHKGGNDWPHEVEIAAELSKNFMGDRFINFEKDRYGDSRTVKI